MRIAATGMLILLAVSGWATNATALTCRMFGIMPPPEVIRTKPTVPFIEIRKPQKELLELCMTTAAVSCAVYPDPAKGRNYWTIVVDSSLSGDLVKCLRIYERAHLPPNFWYDPAAEVEATRIYMDRLKANYLASH